MATISSCASSYHHTRVQGISPQDCLRCRAYVLAMLCNTVFDSADVRARWVALLWRVFQAIAKLLGGIRGFASFLTLFCYCLSLFIYFFLCLWIAMLFPLEIERGHERVRQLSIRWAYVVVRILSVRRCSLFGGWSHFFVSECLGVALSHFSSGFTAVTKGAPRFQKACVCLHLPEGNP